MNILVNQYLAWRSAQIFQFCDHSFYFFPQSSVPQFGNIWDGCLIGWSYRYLFSLYIFWPRNYFSSIPSKSICAYSSFRPSYFDSAKMLPCENIVIKTQPVSAPTDDFVKRKLSCHKWKGLVGLFLIKQLCMVLLSTSLLSVITTTPYQEKTICFTCKNIFSVTFVLFVVSI